MIDSHFVLLNCSSPASVHLFSRSVKLLIALLIEPLWQAVPDHLQRFFEFGD